MATELYILRTCSRTYLATTYLGALFGHHYRDARVTDNFRRTPHHIKIRHLLFCSIRTLLSSTKIPTFSSLSSSSGPPRKQPSLNLYHLPDNNNIIIFHQYHEQHQSPIQRRSSPPVQSSPLSLLSTCSASPHPSHRHGSIPFTASSPAHPHFHYRTPCNSDCVRGHWV